MPNAGRVDRGGVVGLVGTGMLWLAAMMWHLYRIATLRPAYGNLSDTKATFWSFFVVYFLTGLYRHAGVGEYGVPQAAGALIIYLFLLVLLFERPWRSSVLVSVILGASAVMDLMVIVMSLVGGMPKTLATLGEIFLVAVVVRRFALLPEGVKASGYGRRRSE